MHANEMSQHSAGRRQAAATARNDHDDGKVVATDAGPKPPMLTADLLQAAARVLEHAQSRSMRVG